MVPLEALSDGLHYAQSESEAVVWQVYGQRAWRVPVKTGLEDALHVAVEGLPGDALVILHPPPDLRQGELVEVNAP